MKANDRQRLSALSELEREFPGSVIINESTGSITLVGWTLEQLDDAENDEGGSCQVKGDAERFGLSRMSGKLSVGAVKGIEQKSLLVRMIDPLTNTPENATKRSECRSCSRVCLEDSGAVQEKHKCPSHDQDFVPVIKGKFGQRVFHYLSRLFFRG